MKASRRPFEASKNRRKRGSLSCKEHFHPADSTEKRHFQLAEVHIGEEGMKLPNQIEEDGEQLLREQGQASPPLAWQVTGAKNTREEQINVRCRISRRPPALPWRSTEASALEDVGLQCSIRRIVQVST